MVEVKGIVESSMIDYPGKLSLVIFTGGCNFKKFDLGFINRTVIKHAYSTNSSLASPSP